MREERAEALQVELAGLDPDRVPRARGGDPVADDPPQTGHLRLQGSEPADRSAHPELVEEPLTGDDLVRVQEQIGEERPLSLSSQRERPTLRQCLDRSEDPKVHRAS